jgi:histidine ammonia-lyase
MAIVVDGHNLTIEKVVKVARHNEKIELHSEARKRIEKCRALLEDKIQKREIMYGVNTGIGELSEVVLTQEQVEKYQRYIVYSHAAGYGKPLPIDVVRAAMLSRVSCHCHGHSGMRLVVTETMKEMLNKGVTPVVCEKGSVGACGDLSPMSQIALALMGEGEAFYKDERLPSAEALKRAGIQPVVLAARDGLAAINGSNVITGLGALEIYDAHRWIKNSEIAAAMTLEVVNANMKARELWSAPRTSGASRKGANSWPRLGRRKSRTPTACAARLKSSAPPGTLSSGPAICWKSSSTTPRITRSFSRTSSSC